MRCVFIVCLLDRDEGGKARHIEKHTQVNLRKSYCMFYFAKTILWWFLDRVGEVR